MISLAEIKDRMNIYQYERINMYIRDYNYQSYGSILWTISILQNMKVP